MGWKPPKIKLPKIGPKIKVKLPTAKGLKDAFESVGDNPKKAKAAAQKFADLRAVEYAEAAADQGDFDDCVVVVAAACASAGASMGSSSGPWGAVAGAALGAGGGVALARIACRRIFK